MNVLSLFDGISCAMVALERAGIPVNKYYACEIEKNAMKVSKKNYPDIISLGSVIDFNKDMIKEPIDLLVGGSPCQDLSIAKKERKGLEGDRSSLFFEFVRIKNEMKPKYFILENVASMKKEDKDIISGIMGCEPVMFNASLVSAQTRKRYFWTNIQFDLPEDRCILLKDILQPDGEVDERMIIKKELNETAQTGKNETKKLGYVGDKDHQAKRVYSDKGKLPALNVICNSIVKVGHIGDIKEGKKNANEQDGQAHRVYSSEGKTPTLSSAAPLVKIGRIVGRRINEKGHREDDNKSIPIKQRVEVRADEKSNNLSTIGKDNVVVKSPENEPSIIRKLTAIECERLQSLPDNYTEGIAITNRYKCLGNAFNVEVVAHILKHV
jgi:DNA (cytosine-5)-methyltransferase 3A